MRVLLAEDDELLGSGLKAGLGQHGFAVDWVRDGVAAERELLTGNHQAAVLDLGLPRQDGMDTLRAVRAQGLGTPVLVLTARGTVGDRVLGLNAGADDYLAKPFDLDELEARLRALARRVAPGQDAAPAPAVQIGSIRYDRDGGAIYQGGVPMELTPRELALMHALLARPGHAVAKERLFEQVFPGEAEVRYEAIEVVAYRLRRKLAGTGLELVTLRGLGYLLRAAT